MNMNDQNKNIGRIKIPATAIAALLLINVSASSSMGSETIKSVKTTGNDNININEDIRKFCGNIADAARDKRYLIQRQELQRLQANVDERIEALKTYRDEYKAWLDKRNEFLATAEAGLVDIFKKMKPDAAASQLEIIDKNIAAAIIMKLKPSLSSRIFNEMDAETAARLATIIATVVKNEKSQGQT